MEESGGRFNYVYSSELDAELEIKIGSLEGKRNRPSYQSIIEQDSVGYFSGSYQEECSDLFVTVQVFNNGLPITLPVQTSHKSFTTRWNWNEWLSLPIKFSDLPRQAVLAFTIWDYYGTEGMIPIGATTVSIFGKRGTLRKGMHDLRVWPDRKPDPNIKSETPGKSQDAGDRMSQLSKLAKKHRDGHMTKIDWLDRLTFREIELVNEQEKRDSECMYLMIEFPRIHYDNIPHNVVYFEKEGDRAYEFRTSADIVTIHDPELLLENIVESKHHKLARSLRSGPSDKDLKPDASTRDMLNKIVGYPPTKTLSSEEQDLVWKFRYYLSSQKEALAKFLKSVNWKLPQESTAALEMLLLWSPMNVEDALELLSPAFTHVKVRKYAIMRLRQANDEDLLLYLLQLVQALKYENFDEIRNKSEKDYVPPRPEYDPGRRDSDVALQPPAEPVIGLDQHPLSQTLTTSSISSIEDESKLRSDTATTEEEILDAMNTGLSSTKNDMSLSALDDEMDLATFLISRACKNPVIANYLYWYLEVECEDIQSEEVLNMYRTVHKRFSLALSKGPPESKRQRSNLIRQNVLMKKLCVLVESLKSIGSQKKKIEHLQALLHKPEIADLVSNNGPIPLPLDPSVLIKSIVAEKATVFASKLSPCLLTFETVSGKEYKAIFKYGDDLRQDQLILQMFQLMDKLLRHEHLDLQMTPYKVLATSKEHGLVQYVESIALSEVSKEKAIQKFLRQHNPSDTGPFGIVPEVMDNYVKSCAGYCVVTYLLQVGDRHLDNLLLTKSGKMFHIDFGFILGRDPKIMAPPMKLNRQMVEAMGGYDSEHFQRFKVFTYTAFLALRRSANLFLNLFSLMVDTSIPDIALEPDKTVRKVQEKFMLHLNDEQAVQHIQSLIDDSVNAFMPTLMEYGHKMAQALRK
ncbi:phosphatidylinositol 3-kinase catalytic subunit type 3-like [Physella acuta]|uniref:phosphatidylinositol 3-kinase catalytic subunit type 3-like n=1 Tax=Physella acuta TaxID=109671 RepID=UPI0027DE4473|nr:phosphatidylinositol 3-kinase catalytic subunit type 3-like [Physella acuta]